VLSVDRHDFAEAASTAGSAAVATGERGEVLLDDHEAILLVLKPSLLYIPLSCLGSILVILGFTAGFVLLAATGRLALDLANSDAITVGLGFLALRLGWQALDWGGRTYALTDRRILVQEGVLERSLVQIPLSRVDRVAVTRTRRERLFGLGTLVFTVRDRDGCAAAWLVIRDPDAAHDTVHHALRRYGRNGHRGG